MASPAFTFAGILLIFLAFIIEPATMPLILEKPDIPTLTVRPPKDALRKGYPETISFYEPYVKERWGLAYKQMINESFLNGTLFDYVRNRALTPREVKAGTIVGLLYPPSPKLKLNLPKILLLFLGFMMLFLGILGDGEVSRGSQKPLAEISFR